VNIDTIKINPDYGVIITILEYGLIPEKKEAFADLWLRTKNGRTRMIRVAFPYLPDTIIQIPPIEAKLGKVHLLFTEVEPIYLIDKKNLEDKKGRIIAKAMLRAAVKYGAEAKIESELEKKSENLSDAIGFLLNIINVVTERADTREWGTLPAIILVSYKEIPPGRYPISVVCQGDTLLEDSVHIGKGEIKLIKIRKF